MVDYGTLYGSKRMGERSSGKRSTILKKLFLDPNTQCTFGFAHKSKCKGYREKVGKNSKSGGS